MGHNVLITRQEKDLLGAEIVKVYVVCDASGSVKESVHKGLESVPFCVSNLELRQLVFFDILAVHSDQRQGDISTAVSR